MLPGVYSLVKYAEEPSPFGGGKVTPAPDFGNNTITPPKVESVSNVTIGKNTNVNNGTTTSQPPPTQGKPANSMPAKNYPQNSDKDSPGWFARTASGIRGNEWTNNKAREIAASKGYTPEQFKQLQQWADGQYGQSGADRATQLDWARKDLQPLAPLAGDRDGRTGLGWNIGIWNEKDFDLNNQDIRGKVLQQSLKAQTQPEYIDNTKRTGKAYNWLGDNWKGLAAGAGGLLGLGMLSRMSNNQQQVQPQPQITGTGMYQEPNNHYTPFAYRSDSADLLS